MVEEKAKPTIEEIEALLNRSDIMIQVMPDGSIQTKSWGEFETLAEQHKQLGEKVTRAIDGIDALATLSSTEDGKKNLLAIKEVLEQE